MLAIGRHTDYASRIVLDLAALDPGSVVPIARIAQRRLLPTPFVRRVIAALVKAGIVESVRGARGGIRLARRAEAISVLDVVRATEGGIALNRCVETHEFCPFSGSCPVHHVWVNATRALEAVLEAASFSHLAAGQRKRKPPQRAHLAAAHRPSPTLPRSNRGDPHGS